MIVECVEISSLDSGWWMVDNRPSVWRLSDTRHEAAACPQSRARTRKWPLCAGGPAPAVPAQGSVPGFTQFPPCSRAVAVVGGAAALSQQ